MMTEYRGRGKRGEGMLIVFCGPSGVGKGTVMKKFLERDSGCVLSVSATTRPVREGEEDGREYFFVSRERFAELTAAGEMLEYVEYNGNYYGTPKAAVEERLGAGKNVILEIEVQGVRRIRELGLRAVFIFVMPPSWDALRQRLNGRNTETPEGVKTRLKIARDEMEKACSADLFDYIVINDDFEECLAELSAIVKAAGCGVKYRGDFIGEVLRDAKTVDVSDN